MKNFARMLALIAATAMLGGCYMVEPMYKDVGVSMRFDAKSYACGNVGDSKLTRVTVEEDYDYLGSTWYETTPSLLTSGEQKERYAFHPLGEGRYLVSVDVQVSADGPDQKMQIVFIAKINGGAMDFVRPTPEKARELAAKRGLNVERESLIGDEDARHSFFMDIATAAITMDGVEVFYKCRLFE